MTGRLFVCRALYVIASLLVVSFMLHSVQILHEHQGQHGHVHHEASKDGVPDPVNTRDSVLMFGEYMHAAEKKLLLFMLAAFLLTSLLSSQKLPLYSKLLSRVVKALLIKRKERFRSVLLQILKYTYRGLLNPKTF